MASGNSESGPLNPPRAYLVMKAETEEALELAEDWWSNKETPSYVTMQPLDVNDVDITAVFLRLQIPSVP
jgi:hypothetical protein